YQSNAPLTVRAALLDDHIVLGWYIYHLLAKPPEGFDEDKLSVWGHDGWGMIIDRRHPVFNSARDFLIEKYEKRICATELWSYGAQRVP
ncbi:MAG TPA: hypothetical protein VGY58_10850, partial [Gemmataceae bacterium]|nr:hypothetical protein [Gemmataceae bacterium]